MPLRSYTATVLLIQKNPILFLILFSLLFAFSLNHPFHRGPPRSQKILLGLMTLISMTNMDIASSTCHPGELGLPYSSIIFIRLIYDELNYAPV